MTSLQDIEKLAVYNIRCDDERISNIYNLLCEGPLCVVVWEWAHVPCRKSSTAVG